MTDQELDEMVGEEAERIDERPDDLRKLADDWQAELEPETHRCVRTMEMIWHNGELGSDKPQCAACGKDVKVERAEWVVLVIDGGARVAHPGDWDDVDPNDPGHMGWHNLGPECRKKFGEFAKNLKS